MSGSVDERLARELDRAEASGSCLCPATPADRRALERRKRRVRDPADVRIISPVPGLYVRWAHWRGLKPPARCLHLMRGLAALHPDWIFCGPSAALVRGLAVSWSEMRRIHVVCSSRDGRRLSGRIVRHQSEVGEPELVGGLRVTSLVRTAYDCMASTRFPDALAIADSVLRTQGMRRETLKRLLSSGFSRSRGIAHALATCEWADARAENGGESVARAIMIERGVRLPALQVELRDPLDSARSFRVDFSWLGRDGRPTVGELDGIIKYTEVECMGEKSLEEVLKGERRREARITAYDARVVRFSLDEVKNEKTFWAWVKLYEIPYGPAPARRHGVPVPPAVIEGWRPGLSEGVIVTEEGWRIHYRQVAA